MRWMAIVLLIGLAQLFIPSTSHAAAIVDQSGPGTGQFIGSQDYTDVPAYSQSAFDNFTISAPYDLASLTTFGRGTGNPSANIAVVAGIYASPDRTTSPIVSASGSQVGADLVFDFGGATLAAGSYWVSAYVVRPNSGGQWQWSLRTPISGSQAFWHNPGGGFGYGTSPLPIGEILEQADLAFILNGNLASTGLPAPSAPIAALQVRPNPATSEATVQLELATAQHVSADVYDISGRRVRTIWDEVLGPGRHSSAWDTRDGGGRPLAAGTYFFRVSTRTGDAFERVVLVR